MGLATGSSLPFPCPASVCKPRVPGQVLHVGNVSAAVAVRRVCSSLSSPTLAQAPIANDSQLQNFKAWLTQRGALSSSSSVRPQQVESQGFGLVASRRSIAQGEEVFNVPQELWMSVAAARSHPEIGPFCTNLRPWVTLALFLLFEKGRSSSPWRPYIDMLPHNLDSPLFWSNEELSQIGGTQLLGSISGYHQHVESEYATVMQEIITPNPQLFDQSEFTRESFLWAFGILRSRTFPPLTGDDLALVPLADLVNHGMVLNMEGPSWEKKSSGFFPRREYLTLRAPVAVKEGEQVVMQYGKKKGNGQLALDYGFVESSPRKTAVRDSFMLTLEISEADRFFDDKIDIAELNGLSSTVYFDLIHEQELPDNMLPFLRLVALGGVDAFLLEALFRDTVWEHLQLPVSRDNEEAVCKAVLDGCRFALAAYPTTMDEDMSLLNAGELSSRLQMAVAIRLGEKKVLQELQLSFETRLTELDKLEYYAARRLRNLGLLDDKGDLTPWVFEG
ncbi:hypothetical protein L7F22_007529 [Adiantum nelumboides]|nr:hypothetical protein [Adiantum nelumboides]